MRGLLRARFCFFLTRRGFGERAQDGLGIGHPALHSVDRGPHPVSLLACQVLGDAELLVAEYARQKLAAAGGRHRRHHAELFLSREIGVKEFRERHSEPALHQLGNSGDRIGDWRIGAVESVTCSSPT